MGDTTSDHGDNMEIELYWNLDNLNDEHWAWAKWKNGTVVESGRIIGRQTRKRPSWNRILRSAGLPSDWSGWVFMQYTTYKHRITRLSDSAKRAALDHLDRLSSR